MNNLLAIIMAGGAGERLQPLTRNRSKAAVPFGGKFRLVDFTLSNCINSGIRQIYILTQYRSQSLNRHIQEGWDISSSGLGEYIYCVPAQHKRGTDWYRGTADAIRQNLDLIKGKDDKRILVLCGDHIYKMNYLQMLAYHNKKKADLTISAIKVRREEAANTLGVIEIDRNNRMVGFEEKPAQPKEIPGIPEYSLASMSIYIFNMAAIIEALQSKEHDFGKEILPRIVDKGFNVFIYDFEKENKIKDILVEVEDGKRKRILVDRTRDSSYWKDVGTIDSYYQASTELLSVNPLFNLYGEHWPFRTYQQPLPPTKCMLGGGISESIVSDGCIISGGIVRNSILSTGIVVEKDALVEESILFDNVVLEPRTMVRRAIIDKEVTIQADASIGYDAEADVARGCTISDTGIVVIPKGSNIKPI